MDIINTKNKRKGYKMKIKKNYRFMAILLLITLVIQPMQLIKAQAANGAVVTGASGAQYTLDHEYVKQLNINTGNITITDSNYAQTNGLTENWDANEDAYVIKGQGTSANTITISTTNYPVTLYLLETQWSGNIVLSSSSNTASIKIVILGDVSCSRFITSYYTTASSKQAVEIHGYDENSNLYATYLISGLINSQVRMGTFLIDGVNVTCAYTCQTYTSGSGGSQVAYGTYINNFIIRNSEFKSTATSGDTAFYFTYSSSITGDIVIENSVINSTLILDEGTYGTGGIKSVTVKNSKVAGLNFGKRYSANNSMSGTNTMSVTLKNSFITNAGFDNNIKTLTSKNSVIKNSVITNQSLYLDDSTVANAGTSLTSSVLSFNNSSFNSYGTNWVLNNTPTDSNTNDF